MHNAFVGSQTVNTTFSANKHSDPRTIPNDYLRVLPTEVQR